MLHLTKFQSPSTLEKIIKSLREEMIEIGTKEGLTNKKTILISHKLDLYIAEYQALKNVK